MEKTEVNSPFLSADDWLGRHSEPVGQRRTRRLKYEFDDRMGNSKKSRLTLGQFNYYWSLNKLISLPSDSRYRRLTIKGGQFSISPLALLCFIRQRQIAHWKCIAVCTNDNNKHIPFCEMRLLSAQSVVLPSSVCARIAGTNNIHDEMNGNEFTVHTQEENAFMFWTSSVSIRCCLPLSNSSQSLSVSLSNLHATDNAPTRPHNLRTLNRENVSSCHHA